MDDRNYRISMKRIYFDSVTKDSAIVAINDSDEYLTAISLRISEGYPLSDSEILWSLTYGNFCPYL